MRRRNDVKDGNSLNKGSAGEKVALEELLKRGFVFLGSNVRIGHKEIDLIMDGSNAIHFIEVKSCFDNGNCGFGGPFSPLFRVDRTKRLRLLKAADSYLKSRKILKDAVFDIVLVNFDAGGKPCIEVIEDAFNAVTG